MPSNVQANRRPASGHPYICPQNSTYTALDGAAVFTGGTADVHRYSSITLVVNTDQDGTLAMQFSPDGANWDTSQTVEIAASVRGSTVRMATVVSQFFRVVYTNGSTAQGHLRLQVIFHPAKSPVSTPPLNQEIALSDTASLVRQSNWPLLDFARGLHPDMLVIHQFGSNASVDTVAEEDVWAYGGTYAWPTTAETVRIAAGGDANDTAAGTGARSVIVFGLSDDLSLQSEVLVTDGVNASAASVNTYRRIYGAAVAGSGTYGGTNIGNIVIENTTSNQVLAYIVAGFGQSQLSQFTIPVGYNGYFMGGTVQVDSQKPAEVRLWIRTAADTVAAPFGPKQIVARVIGLAEHLEQRRQAFVEIPEKTDVWSSAVASSNGTGVDISYDLVLVRNETASEA